MDLQILSAAHLDRDSRARFDPKRENDYYQSAGREPWLISAGRRVLQRGTVWAKHARSMDWVAYGWLKRQREPSG